MSKALVMSVVTTGFVMSGSTVAFAEDNTTISRSTNGVVIIEQVPELNVSASPSHPKPTPITPDAPPTTTNTSVEDTKTASVASNTLVTSNDVITPRDVTKPAKPAPVTPDNTMNVPAVIVTPDNPEPVLKTNDKVEVTQPDTIVNNPVEPKATPLLTENPLSQQAPAYPPTQTQTPVSTPYTNTPAANKAPVIPGTNRTRFNNTSGNLPVAVEGPDGNFYIQSGELVGAISKTLITGSLLSMIAAFVFMRKNKKTSLALPRHAHKNNSKLSLLTIARMIVQINKPAKKGKHSK